MTVASHGQRGLAELELGRPDTALEAFGRALDDMREGVGPEHPGVGTTMGQVGRALLALGRVDEARAQLEASLALLQQIEAEPSLVHEARFHLARVRWEAGEHETARTEAQDVLRWLERHGPPVARQELEAWLRDHPLPP